MARRSDHSKEEIREMSLSAAESIVAGQGFAGLSARKIAKQIGYTVGTLYTVFDNLDDLILHVNSRTLDALYNNMRLAVNDCNEPQQCVLAMGRAYVDFATLNPQRWSMVFEHRLPEDVPVPDWFVNKVNKMFQLVQLQLTPMLGGQTQSSIDLISKTIWCGVHGICALAVTDKLEISDAESIHELTDSLIKNYITGLALALTLKGEK